MGVLILRKLKIIKQETMADQEAQSDIGEEYIEKVCIRKADVAAKLTCMGCNGFFRGTVTYCQNKHGLCSNCFEDKKECPVTGCAQKAFLALDFLSELVKDLKFPVPCKFKKDGCDQENADEDVISDHEVECGFRKVPCFKGDCPDQPAMDFVAHLFSAHDEYGKFYDNPGKWYLQKFVTGKMMGAQKMWIDPESGLRFWTILVHYDEKEYWRCCVVVFAGQNVA